MDRLDMDSFDLVYARMLFVAGRRTQSELADILGLRQGSISEAKKRGYVPMQWFVRVADAFNVEIDWLRFGKPPIFRKKEDSQAEQGSVFPDGANRLCEPDISPLEGSRVGELPVYSTVFCSDGSFPLCGRQVFPLEFLQEGIQVFRVLDATMAPTLNVGALVAVVRDKVVKDGDVVAVFGRSGLCFRRARRTKEGYELRGGESCAGKDMYLVPRAEWSGIYYGKAVWAFQPL